MYVIKSTGGLYFSQAHSETLQFELIMHNVQIASPVKVQAL